MGIFILIFLLVGALQIPYVQTKATQKAIEVLSEKLNYPIHIGGVDISWLDTAILDDVCIKDDNKDTLLYIQETYIDFRLLSFLAGKTVIDNVFLVNPKMNILYQEKHKDLNLNHFIDAIMTLIKKDDNIKDDKKTDFKILTATLHNASFEYFHTEKDSIKHIDASKNFNYHHFSIVKLFTHLENFHITEDTVAFHIVHLSGHEKNNDFKIKDFNSEFLYTNSCLEFDELDAYIQNSFLSNKIRFDYKNMGQFSHFVDSVRITADLEKSIIYTKDLGYFAPEISKFDDKWTVSGQVRGTVSDLKLRDFAFSFGKQSTIQGNISLEGLPKIEETFMQIRLKKSVLAPTDLQQYLPTQYYTIATTFGKTDFQTELTGFSTNFVANGNFKTAIGTIETDLKFAINKENEALSYYKGKLKTEDFQLGKFLSYQKLGKLDMEGNVEGTGFKIENAKVKLDAQIDRLGFNDYDYRNISTDSAIFDKKSFRGNLSVKDPNLDVDIHGSFSLDGNNSVFNINSIVKTANLLPLNLTKDDIRFQIGFSSLVFQGLELDSIQGKGFLENTKIAYNDDSLAVNFFVLDTKLKENNEKEIHLFSEYLNVSVNGNFTIENTYTELLKSIEKYSSSFTNKQHKVEKTHSFDENHHVFYTIELVDINPILKLINPKIYIAEQSKIFGEFTYGLEHHLQLNGFIDSLAFDKLAGKGNEFFFNSQEAPKDKKYQANYYVNNQFFYFNNEAQAENTNFEALWKNDTIRFSTHSQQFQRNNSLNLMGEIALGNEKTSLHFIESEINLLKDKWHFDPLNAVTLYKDSISFSNFDIEFNEQKFGLEGSYGKENENSLIFSIKDFNLQNLKKISNVDIEGLLSSQIYVDNLKNKQILEGTLKIKKLASQGIVIGDIDGNWYWDNHLKWMVSNAKVVRNKRLIFSLNGYYNTFDKNNALNYTLKFERTPLEIAEQFGSEHISNAKGTIDGFVHVKGSLENPSFNGNPMLHCQSLTVNYLQTTYRFNEEIVFKGDSILFPNFQLNDTKEQTNIRITGGLQHKMFTNFNSNLQLKLNNSLVLDTKAEDNSLFYGRVFASGIIDLKGPFDNLRIESAELTTEKGSALYIPLNKEETITTKDYIKFVNKQLIEEQLSEKTKAFERKVEKGIKLGGLVIDFNLFITPATSFEIIFDEQAGEKITANGGGNIQMMIDTRGDFKMSGIYEIKQGSYNFTLANFINKKFEIAPNSKITWNGSPYDGTLDIQARYRLTASLLPLLSVDSTFKRNNPDALRPVNTAALLKLNGSLLSPQIKFGIEIPNYPRYFEVEQGVQNLFSTINFNEQELNRQVFSLIALKQFAGLNEFNLKLGSTSASTVSELLSNQFSSWISQFDENLQVNIDLSGFDAEANGVFRVRMIYNILDGKIRVTREGNVTNLDNNNQLANIFGEWTIEYLITNDGKIKMKAYNRAQNNMITSANGANNTSMICGMSLTHTADFDNLRELFKNNKNTEQVENLEPIESPKDSIPIIDSTQIILPDSTQLTP